MRGTIKSSLLISTAIVVSACGDKPIEEKKDKPLVYKTQSLSNLAVPIEYSAPATASSLNESTLKAEISARIDAIPAKVGEVVSKGDVLVKLNCSDAKSQLLQASANLDAAKARAQLAEQQLQRAISLKKKRSVSEELLSQRESEASAANAEQKARDAAQSIAQNQVKRCNITSPFNAIVTERTGQVGELATAGAPMMKVVSTEGLEVSADIVPTDGPSLEQVSNIAFLSPAPYPVKLRALTGVIGSLTRTREARLTFIDQQPLPGTPGRLSWSDTRPGIPSQYITERQGQLGVFIAEDNKAKFIALPYAQEGRAVATDLTSDTLIITTGRNTVSDGDILNKAANVTAEAAE